ncbi:MAG: ABC transporter permease [Paracoccaceae bacterium]
MSVFRGTLALAHGLLTETRRAPIALFWNLAFPLLILVGLMLIFGGDQTAQQQRVLGGVLTINLIAAAFFGISLHMVSLREAGLYRRYHATPISSLSVVAAHSITASVNVLGSLILQLIVARFGFGVAVEGSILTLVAVLLLAAFAFIPLGLIVGSIGRDMRIAPALSNLLFFPMAFLSGAAIPLSVMPEALQRIATLLPATYVVDLFRGAIQDRLDLWSAILPASILVATGLIAFACNTLLFRWESSAPLDRRGLGLVVVGLGVVYLAAFVLTAPKPAPIADVQVTPPPVAAADAPEALTIFIGATIWDGSGRILSPGRMIVSGDRITSVTTDDGTSPPEGAEMVNLSGLYVIPGLIESHTHLGASGGGAASSGEFIPARIIHDLQVYLALGVTSVVSMTDLEGDMQRLRDAVATGQMRAPRVFLSGRSLTAPGGYPAAIFAAVPGLSARAVYQLETPEAADAAVRELANTRVDVVKLNLEAGRPDRPFAILAEPVLRRAIETARSLGLPTTVHVDNDDHARLAVSAGAAGIEHVPTDLSASTTAALAANGLTLTPTLAAYEGLAAVLTPQIALPETKGLVLPVVLDSLRSPDAWFAGLLEDPGSANTYSNRFDAAKLACRSANAAGVTILAGSDAGSAGVFPGLGLLRELELLVSDCGMTPEQALKAATGTAANRLGTRDVGRLITGAYADFVVLGADPLKEIEAVGDVRAVYFGGLRINQDTLFTSSPGPWLPSGPEEE